jgi:predicted  nucleic acid-binding Zn-ribbon protein
MEGRMPAFSRGHFMIDEKVKIKCTKCSQVFRERAQRLRNGFQTNCQHCNRLITFDISSEDKNIRRALKSAREVRMALEDRPKNESLVKGSVVDRSQL